MMVDFPAPFFPIKAILSVGLMENETLLKSVLPLKSTPSASADIILFCF
jgi:uncharacterized paraquat-inducible protein A